MAGFLRSFLALLLLTGAVRAFAQQPTELPAVLVPLPAPEPSAASPGKVDPSGASSVVQVGERRHEVKELAELAATAPGVLLRDSGGLGQAKTLSLRGSAPNGVLVLLDGIPLNGAGGNVDLSLVPAAIVERLEVLRGGAGARYGSGGLGGVVNVVTRSPEASARAFLEATAGSFSTQLVSAGVSGELLGAQGLLLLHGERSDGDFPFLFDDKPALEGNEPLLLDRRNNQAAQAGVLLRAKREGAVELDALAEALWENRGLAGPAQNPTPEGWQRSGRLSASLRATHESGGAELGALVFAKDEQRRLGGGLYGSGLLQSERLGGLELFASRLVADRHGLSGSAGLAFEGLWAPDGEQPSRAKLFVMASDEALFFDGALALTPSLRLERNGRFVGFSPKLGLSVLLPHGFELRANAGQAHRAPSFLELYVKQGHLLPNEGLRPERALYGDLCAAHRGANHLASLGAFYSLYEDLIVYEFYPPMLARPFNFAAAEAYGLEAEAQVHPHPWLSAQASYTLLFSTNLKDEPRYYLKELPYRPRHRLYARAAFGPEWLSARADLLYQSSQYQNRAQTLVLPSRALLNAGLQSTPWKKLELTASIEVKNLLDVHSVDLDGYPLPSRGLYLTLATAYSAARR